MLDLIVIGAGLSGLVAACTAAQAGLKVKVIAKGWGALHWNAGTVDVLGYYPDGRAPVERPLQTVQELVKTNPLHPYALLNGTGLVDTLASFLALTHEIGLPYASHPGHSGQDSRPGGIATPGFAQGERTQNWMLPSPVGARRPTFLAPQAQSAGDLDRDEAMLIVGFRGMRDFFPEWIAENLNKQGRRARAACLPLDLITDRHDSNTVQLALELDRPARRSKLAAELRRLAGPGERIGLPAILGLDEHATAMNDLRAQTDRVIFEISTLPPSVPGIRLNTALRRKLQALGVRVELNMEVMGFQAEGGCIAWVETETSARPLRHRAEKFLLATGGILGGGINSDHRGRMWEVCFDLPLAMPQNRGEWFRPRFLDPAGHPIFSGGVQVNREFQPIDSDGAPVYTNLWAAGGILAHADPVRARSVEGIAIATGVASAQHLTRPGATH